MWLRLMNLDEPKTGLRIAENKGDMGNMSVVGLSVQCGGSIYNVHYYLKIHAL